MTPDRIKAMYKHIRESERHLIITVNEDDDMVLDMNLDVKQLIEIVNLLDEYIAQMQ